MSNHPKVPGFFLENGNWYCRECVAAGLKPGCNGRLEGKFASSTANQRLENHLEKAHGLKITRAPKSAESASVSEVTDLDSTKASESPAPYLTSKNQAKLAFGEQGNLVLHSKKTAKAAFQKLTVSFAARHALPLSIFESEEFEALIRSAEKWQPDERDSMPTRKNLTSTLEAMATDARQLVWKVLNSKYVLLLADGGTMNRKRFINFSIACEGTVYFHETCAVNSTDGDSIAVLINQQIDFLATKGITVIGMCSDNASNFQKAAGTITHDDEDTREESADEELDRMLGIAVDKKEDDETRFFVHVRCWAHTFQLILNDAFAKCAFLKKTWEKAHAVISLFTPKYEQILRDKMTEAKVQPLAIIRGCDTRWNSKVAAMYRLLEIGPVIADVVECEEVTRFMDQLHIACTFLYPLCFATVKVQADNMTVIDAIPLFEKTQVLYSELLTHNYSDMSRTVIVDILSNIKASLQTRWTANFNNKFIQHIKLLTPPLTLDTESKKKLVNEVVKLFSNTTDRAALQTSIMKELNSIIVNQAPGLINFKEFWDELNAQYTYLPVYVSVIGSAALTEAAVERTFSLQARVYCASRNRLAYTTLNNFLICNDTRMRKRARVETIDVDAADQGGELAKETSNDDRLRMTFSEFQRSITCYQEGTKPAIVQRVQTRSMKKMAFARGSCIKIWRGDAYANAIICTVPEPGEQKYRVAINGAEFIDFDPSVHEWIVDAQNTNKSL